MKAFKEFIEKEYSVLDLSNELIYLGCDDICDIGDLKWLIKNEKNISVSTKEYDEIFGNYKELNFQLDIIEENDDINKLIIKVIDVEEL